MTNPATFSVFTKVAALPDDWDIVAGKNIFLGTDYLRVLEHAAPENMECYFIGIYQDGRLQGVASAQFLDFTHITTFGARDNCVKNKLRTFFFKRFSSRVLIMGNNMLTGQNSFVLANKNIMMEALTNAAESIIKSLGSRAPHLVIWKDFVGEDLMLFPRNYFSKYYQFSTQPNMILSLRPEWISEADYVGAFLKKYRDQYKRARKKITPIESRILTEAEIVLHRETIHNLYMTVARNAPFNTFFLTENHFEVMKACLNERFIVTGYFAEQELVGFSTMILNGADVDTYFLGYDENYQREKMLYLNMLYDMISYAIGHRFRKIILARTALEIKSSVGAEPLKMYGFISHRNSILNRFMPRLFKYFEPELKWQQRHPFRDRERPPSSGEAES